MPNQMIAKSLSSKEALLPDKKKESEFPAKHAHLHSIIFVTTMFHEILLSGFRGVALTNCFSSTFISKF